MVDFKNLKDLEINPCCVRGILKNCFGVHGLRNLWKPAGRDPKVNVRAKKATRLPRFQLIP